MNSALRHDRTPEGPAADRRGIALIFTLLMSIAVAAMALGAIMLSSGAELSTRYSSREASLQAAANGGLELIRDSVNRGTFDSLLPFNSFTTLVTGAPVYDASGTALPRVTRSLYVGRTGGRTGGAATAGQYGSNFASAVSIIRDQRGAVAARRLLMTQDSWAKFAVAINDWPGLGAYGCNESITGPFHSNDILRLSAGCSPKILFAGATTVVGSVSNQPSGNFVAGLKIGVSPIPWPTPAKIALMRQYAQDGDAANGDYDLSASTVGSHAPGLRIEFLSIDVNGNGLSEWTEGFMRVWRASNSADSTLAYATGRRWPSVPTGTTYSSDPNMVSRNCGAVAQIDGVGPSQFRTASEVYNFTTGGAATSRPAVRTLLTSGTRRCYLGGDPRLFPAATFDSLTPDSLITNAPGVHPFGWWIKRRTGPVAALASVRPGDDEYLIPLGSNPNFKGVVFVSGDVAISGRVRGRVSVFATGNIVLADDLLYTNTPGTKCDAEGDIFGAIATINMIISDNAVQTPFRVNNVMWGGFDDTPRDESYNMFFLAAGNTAVSGTGNFFTTGLLGVPGIAPPYRMTGAMSASATAEVCAGGPGGCVRITGGLGMGKLEYYTYSAAGSANAYGYAEAHTYDPCGAVNPPPYFPTTGRFTESRYYELDPVWLNQMTIATYFERLRAQ